MKHLALPGSEPSHQFVFRRVLLHGNSRTDQHIFPLTGMLPSETHFQRYE